MTGENDSFELTRRKALLGLSTVGAASAAAGMGTTAFLNDTEEFEGNSLTAGELDLKVAWAETYNYQGTDTTLENTGTSGCADTTAAASIDLGDVKPGDEGSVEFEFQLCTNPGYVWLFSDIVSQSENGVNEPEGDSPAEQGSTAFGRPIVELLDAVEVTLAYTGGETILDTTLRNFLRKSNEAMDRGIYGIPLDGDRATSYDEYESAAGGRAAVDAFVDPGVNVFYDFETDNDYSATIESADDPASGGRGSVAHVTSGGTPTRDYVTSTVTLGGIPSDNLETLEYDYYEGSDNDNAAPDEVYLDITDGGGDSHLVFLTANDGTTGGSWKTRDVHAEITGSDSATRPWIEIEDDGTRTQLGDDLTATYSSFDLEAVAIGRGSTGTDRVLDVYYGRLRSEDSTGTGSVFAEDPFPTVDSEYADLPTRNREAFPGGSTTSPSTDSVTLSWRVPEDVGNEIQSDTVTFDLGLYAEQARHNDGSGA